MRFPENPPRPRELPRGMKPLEDPRRKFPRAPRPARLLLLLLLLLLFIPYC